MQARNAGSLKHPSGWVTSLVIAGTLVFCQSANGQGNELRATNPGPFQFQVAQPPAVGSNLSGGLTTQPVTGAPRQNVALPGDTAATIQPVDFQALISQLAMSTFVVLGLCVAGLLLIKKFNFHSRMGKASTNGDSNDSAMNVEGTLRLGRNNYLQVVQAGGARLVVGSDASGIKSIVQVASVFSHSLAEADAERKKSVSGEDVVTPPRGPKHQAMPVARFGYFHAGNQGL